MSSHFKETLKFVGNQKQFCQRLGELPESIANAVFQNGGRDIASKAGIRAITKLVMEEIGREHDGKA